MSFRIDFLPHRRSWQAAAPMEIGAAAAECGLLIEQPCGGGAACGKCRVRVVAGDLPEDEVDRRVLGHLVEDGWRLACGLIVSSQATIELPAGRREVRMGKGFGADGPLAFRHTADPAALERARARGTTALGVAFDVGTTTVAAALVDLASGAVLATASALNPQVRWGADVMSRIQHAREHAAGAVELRDAVRGAMRSLIATCVETAHADSQAVGAVTCIGNPTMMHALLGLELASLGEAPFVGPLRGSWRGPASELGLGLAPDATVYVAPEVRSHVGGDTVASIVATDLDRVQAPMLMVDLGTNSEVVLATPGGIACASTAAGPAFEGAQISQGMLATTGAIDRVRLRRDGSLVVHVIAGATPLGICGSGLIDAVAELLRAGIIAQSGRMEAPRVRLTDRDQPAVYLTAGDVRQLQLVKASIAAGVGLLLEHCGVRAEELERVLLAGAFGSYLRQTSAIAIGLVPPVDAERVVYAGCTAGAGARLLLVDADARDRAEHVAADAEHVDLAAHPRYEAAFVDALAFPAPLVTT